MDKTLEIVVAAAVLMLIGAFLFFMLSDSSGDFGKTTGSEIDKSECRLLESEWDLASSTSERQDIESEADDKDCDTSDWGSASGP